MFQKKVNLRYILNLLFVAYLAYVGFLFTQQRKGLFNPPPLPDIDSSAQIPNLEKVWLETSFGKTEAWFMPPIPNTGEPAPVLIFTHGNAELIDFWVGEFGPAQEMGLAVLLVEYPGYGRSEGKPTQKTITETMLAAYDFLLTRPDIDPERIIAHGRSLGGGAACALADERPVAALILQSTFKSTAFFARIFWAPGFLMLDKFNNLKVVKNYDGPVLVIHGESDWMIPLEQAVELSQASENAQLITYPCHHNDCPMDEEYWEDVRGFLEEWGLLP